MKDINFKLYKELLFNHFRRTIEDFAATAENKDVYAVVLDAQGSYGFVNMKWNTISSFENTVEKTYSSYTQDRLYGFRGLKYSVGDFTYEDFVQPQEIKDFSYSYETLLSQYFENEEDAAYLELYQKFIDILIEVVNELKPCFALLDKTDHFIAYVVDHDEDDFKYMMRTVSLDEYYTTFPEIRDYEQYVHNIYRMSEESQIAHWCALLSDFLLEKDSEEVRKLKQMYRYRYDVEDEIKKLGSIATSNIVSLYEIFSGYIPSVDGSIIKSSPLTRWTFLSMLLDIKCADEGTIERLRQILVRKYQIDNESQECINIARTLHALDPSRFPKEEHDERRVKLLNFQEYQSV